jgi:hypothetical protein
MLNKEDLDKITDESEQPVPDLPLHRMYHRRNTQNPTIHKLRTILNIIFMIGAFIGVIFYFVSKDTNLWIYIILVSMVPKFIELCLRLIK